MDEGRRGVGQGVSGEQWSFRLGIENITSKPTCYAQLQVAEGIGGFEDTNASYSVIGGILIQGIGGLENQNNGGPGWQYYLNDVYALRSCSLTYLSNGDTVLWMYKPLAG